MSLFDQLKRQFSQQAQMELRKAAQSATHSAANAVRHATEKTWTVTFEQLPATVEELKALPEADLSQPHYTAALTVAALCAAAEDREAGYAMLDYLRGPRPLSPADKQHINDRFMDGRSYIPRSYFDGAVPDNDYTPTRPLMLRFTKSAAPFAEENYLRLMIHSGGADSPRSVTLRQKPSTGQWFLWEQDLLAGIRQPKSSDPWA